MTAAISGKRYRRQDEIGTPACVMLDFDISIRMMLPCAIAIPWSQARVGIGQLGNYFEK